MGDVVGLKATLRFKPLFLASALWISATGCGKNADVRSPHPSQHVRVLSLNLDDHRFKDRDGDFQANDPKPAQELVRLVELIASSSPDVLLVREIGNALLADEFAAALAEHGADYAHRLMWEGGEDDRNMAILSRYPVGNDTSRTNDVYRIGVHTHRMARPIVDIEITVPSGRVLRIIHTHLRGGPVPTATDTYEMRRNEARLLTQHIRRILRENSEGFVLVAGTLHSEPDTPLLNDLLRGEVPLVFDVRPTDALGDAWTEYQPEGERHLRTDYLMVSPSLHPKVRERIIPHHHVEARGSRFRALWVTLEI